MRLFEFGDLEQAPQWYHVNLRRYLVFFYKVFGYHGLWVPALTSFMRSAKDDAYLELGSGGGEALRLVVDELPDDMKAGKRFLLSDINPVSHFVEETNAQADSPFRYHPVAVDATQIPDDLAHPRIFINSFHHFSPQQVKANIRASTQAGQATLVLEYVRNTPLAYLSMVTGPVVAFLTVPFVVRREDLPAMLLFTYLIPAFPLMMLWDGIVSCARAYTAKSVRTALGDNAAAVEISSYVKRDLMYPAGVTAITIVPKDSAHMRNRSG